MSILSIFDWSSTAGSNTDIAGNGIQTSSNASLGSPAFQNLMAQVATGLIARGSDIATASTLDFTGATTRALTHDLTGTTTVTAVTITAGHWRICMAQGAFQITASSSLIVNGSTSVNYTTTAGDLLFFRGYSAGVVRVWTVSGGATGAATTSTAGTVKLATNAQAQAGTDSSAAVVSSALAYSLVKPNLARNGSFAVAQRAMPTSDNTYCLDGWKLMLGAANAATVAQDTADVPTGAGYALKLTVGSGNNNKFGVWSPLENKDVLPLRGGVVSLRVPLKATAGLTDGTGKIRIGIAQFTGTADSISGSPISAWGAEGTNPTLATNWAFANTPAAISVTTSWADYLVENVSISASATNLAIFIWSDDKANTASTDILRIGGYVTLVQSPTASLPIVLPYSEELRRCQRYFSKSYADGTAPGTATDTGLVWIGGGVSGVGTIGSYVQFPVKMRTSPSVSYWDGAGAASKCSTVNASAGTTFTDGNVPNAGPFVISDEGFAAKGLGTTATNSFIQYTADADL